MIKALIAVAALLGLDQLVKLWTVNELARMPGGEIQLWPGVFHLTYVQNRGAAFGMLQNQLWLFALATVVLVGGLIYVLWRMRRSGPALLRVSLVLIIAGGIGNFIDRLARGFVVDMFYVKLIDFAVFNVADMCVVIGVALMCFYILFMHREPEKVAAAGTTAGEDGAPGKARLDSDARAQLDSAAPAQTDLAGPATPAQPGSPASAAIEPPDPARPDAHREPRA
jgi:signal peptidase II